MAQRATRKFSKTLRKTAVFRFRASHGDNWQQSTVLGEIASQAPDGKVIGPYAERETFHLWEPRPKKHGRPTITDAQRAVRHWASLNVLEIIRA